MTILAQDQPPPPHGLGDDSRSVVAAEPHAVRLLALLEGDDELVVGLAGLEQRVQIRVRMQLCRPVPWRRPVWR